MVGGGILPYGLPNWFCLIIQIDTLVLVSYLLYYKLLLI